jgi:hypothetical protein
MKPGRVRKLPRLHQALMLSDALPTSTEDSIVTQKIKLLAGIAALKDGTFGYPQLCEFHDFIALALRFCDQFKDERLRGPAEECAVALTGIMERHVARGIYTATGDELRALQSWVEEIAEYLGSFPEMTINALRADLVQEELELRARIAAEKAKEAS